MRFRPSRLLLLSVLALAACGGDALEGTWTLDGKVRDETIKLEFDGKGDKVIGHVDGPEGLHEHRNGTYTFDGGSNTITVKAKLIGDGNADTWTGTLAGESFELKGGDARLKFQKGGKAH